MLVILTLCALILVIIFGVEMMLKDRNFDEIPGPTGIPIIANGLDFMQDQEKTFYLLRRLVSQYKDLFKLRIGPIKNCAIYNPEDIEVLISRTKNNSKGFLYRFLKPWLQGGLLLSDGEKWRHRRKILTPAFHFNILKQFNKIFIENCHNLVKKIERESCYDRTDLLPLITDFTLHSLCETALGQKLEQETTDYADQYKLAIHKLGAYILYRTQRVWLYPNFLFNLTPLCRKQNNLLKLLSSFRDNVIRDKINKPGTDDNGIFAPEEQDCDHNTLLIGNKRLALLDLLLQCKKEGNIDTEGICEEIDTFMFEGHDTTAAALQFIFMVLANNQEAQDKIIQEYTDVLGSLAHDATMSDLKGLKYLECCIKESLRLYPPVPFFSRRCHQPCKLTNYTLPAGTDVTVLVYDLHRREDIFPEASVFRPERFLTDQPSWHQYAYIPFSAGPRNCIGQKFAMLEMKQAVSSVLRRFRLRPVTKPEDIVYLSDIILRSRDPVYVKFEIRV